MPSPHLPGFCNWRGAVGSERVHATISACGMPEPAGSTPGRDGRLLRPGPATALGVRMTRMTTCSRNYRPS